MDKIIQICHGCACSQYLSQDLLRFAEQEISDLKLTGVVAEKCGCMAQCSLAPNVRVVDNTTQSVQIYNSVDTKQMTDIIQSLGNS